MRDKSKEFCSKICRAKFEREHDKEKVALLKYFQSGVIR